MAAKGLAMTGADRLVLGRVATRCTAVAGPAVAVATGARLDRAVREDLPAALARAAAPVISAQEGVVRLRRLRVRLDLGDGLDEAAFARLLAERIVGALKAALAGGAREVRHWPDHASHMAAYILFRAGLGRGEGWAFPDFAALEHLPAERAAAELILARPEVLARLAVAPAARGDPADPVARWPVEAQAALARALLLQAAAEAPPLEAALRLLQEAGLPPPARRSAALIAAEALRVTLRLLARGGREPAPQALLLAVAAVLTLQERAARPAGEARAEAPTGPDAEAAALAAAVACAAAGPTTRRLLFRLARPAGQPAAPEAKAADPAAPGRAGRARPAAVEAPAARSPRAGLALLMPSALLLDAPACLAPTALAQALWQALDPEDWADAAQDGALQRMLPVEPREVDMAAPQPDPPPRLLRGLAPEAFRVMEGADPARRWSALLMADLASRLRGLHGSSHPYLRRQFLQRPGLFDRGPDRLTVRLDPLPLGILLRMAGLTGPQGRLPQPGLPRLVLQIGGEP